MKKIQKLLIANRGEIALRIIRACKEMGIKSVAIYSEVDSEGLWVKQADESHLIKGDVLQAYLNYQGVLAVAKRAGCDAIHTGYGFLSEDADFARECEKNGLIFVGPKADHIALFGDKMASKVAMKKVGVPVVEGIDEPIEDKAEGAKIAEEIGYPVIIKAAFGGGGRGMRIVHKSEEFESMFDSAKAESLKFFGKGDMFVEKYVSNPRHIEIQIMADKEGNVIHLGERDCSIQRRHQKVIEIAPSPRLNPYVRKELYHIASTAMYKLGYESVGTMEFLLDEADNIYFIEMNTRVQVEHPVTEQISGIDIIQNMIKIAAGEKLSFEQEDISFRGYAIEFRINAENPENKYLPSSGVISEYNTPGGLGIRIDSAVYVGYNVPTNYDSMIGKLIVSSHSWEDTVSKAKRALDEFSIEGLPTNLPLHQQIVRDQDFIDGKFTTGYLDEKLPQFNVINPETRRAIEKKRKSIFSKFLF